MRSNKLVHMEGTVHVEGYLAYLENVDIVCFLIRFLYELEKCERGF